MNNSFKDKKIVLGVTGGIAAYKSCLVLRLFQAAGCDVRVVMTEAAQKFITPLTFETLSGNEVVTSMFPDFKVVKTRHVRWAEWADAILVCPATANIIGKTACGIADDFLSTLLMASRRPLIFAPAMDYEMVQNSIYLANRDKLKSFGHHFIETETGHLASGAVGPGRLADPDTIFQVVNHILNRSDILQGKRILITAGPTRESLDPVRFLSNRSTGTMGVELSTAAYMRGAEVTLISGHSSVPVDSAVNLISVETAAEMHRTVMTEWESHDILIMAAAVADYTPSNVKTKKIKKSDQNCHLDLKRTADIIRDAAAVKKNRIVVGFALETENSLENGKRKLHEKDLDLICLNDCTEPGAGFGTGTNSVRIVDRSDRITDLGTLTKRETAFGIIDYIQEMLK